MPLTRYHFANAVSAFYEINRDAAKQLLPSHLEPMEVKHGLGVFAITAFHFTESEVGEYDEIVLAIITPPQLGVTGEFPRSAFFPFVVGTSSEASRSHAIERWHLPHYMSDIAADFNIEGGRVGVRVREGDRSVLDFSVSDHKWSRVNHLYQAFMVDDSSGKYRADIHMEGEFAEHEEETGDLELHRHPMSDSLLDAGVASYPFRELWMKNGVQTFEELQTL